LPTRQVGRKLGHECVYAFGFLASYSLDLDKLLTGFGRDRIAGITAIFYIKFNGLTDVGERLDTRVPLTDTPRQSRNTNDEPPSDSRSRTTV
jgi:hypothetical protein